MCPLCFVHGTYQQNIIHLGVCNARNYASQTTEKVENWQVDAKLVLLNHPDDPSTFYSRRWKTTTTPDLAFATDDIARGTIRHVLDQLAGSDHRPIMLTVDLAVQRIQA